MYATVKVNSQVENAFEMTAIAWVFARSLYEDISLVIAQAVLTSVTACHAIRRFLVVLVYVESRREENKHNHSYSPQSTLLVGIIQASNNKHNYAIYGSTNKKNRPSTTSFHEEPRTNDSKDRNPKAPNSYVVRMNRL